MAESCTGGLLGHALTETGGASHYFSGGVIAYSNNLKRRLLKVPAAILAEHGAVSSQTAEAMARGVKVLCKSDYSISITGVAGPGGGTTRKPVGTVYVCIVTPGLHCWRFQVPLLRRPLAHQIAKPCTQAITLLNKTILENIPP